MNAYIQIAFNFYAHNESLLKSEENTNVEEGFFYTNVYI